MALSSGAGARRAATVPAYRRARGPACRHYGRGRCSPPGDGLCPGRGAAGGIRPLHGDHHDRRRGAVRLVPATHQRPDQRDLDRGPERRQFHSRRGREDPGRGAARIHGRRDPAGHHLDASRGSHALHLPLGHRRLHARSLRAARARPDEEPARPGADGRRPRQLRLSLLADDDPGRGRQYDDAADRPGDDRDGARVALDQGSIRVAPAARTPDHGADDGGRRRLVRAGGQGRAGRGRDPGQVADAAASGPRLRARSGTRGRRARDRRPRPAGGHCDGQGDRGANPAEAQHEPAVPQRGSRQLHRQLLSMHARIGVADALCDQPAGRGGVAVVGSRVGGGGGTDRRGVRPVRAPDSPRRAGRDTDASRRGR